MNTKHTPGPWQAYEAFSGQHYVGTPHKGTGHFVIADVMPYKMETIHNSRLIAAAPDLLAALEAALPQIQRFRCTDPNGETCDNPILQQAREAIAKAKGE